MMLDMYRLFASMEKNLSQTIEKVDETARNKFSFYMYSVLFGVFFFILTEIPPYLLYPGPLQILDTGSQIY